MWFKCAALSGEIDAKETSGGLNGLRKPLRKVLHPCRRTSRLQGSILVSDHYSAIGWWVTSVKLV